MRNRSGGSSTSASPSIPAGTGPSASTSKSGADHSRNGRCTRPAALAALRGLGDDRDPEQAVVDPRPRARADCAAEPVAVVGDEHHRTGVVHVPARAGPAQVELAAAGAEHVRHGVEQRAQLRVAIALSLDGLGIEPERDVVHEHAPVDLGQVHGSLAAVHERVEGADDVVAVDAEVEREVVARAGGHARVRQPALGRERRDDRLRAVAAGHRERVGAAIDGPANERLEVVAGLQLDRLDPARACLVGEREALRLPATRARVEEEHRVARRRRARQRHVHADGGAPGRKSHQEPRHDQQLGEQRLPRDEQRHRTGQRQRGDGEPRHARNPPPQHAVPGRRAGDQHAGQQAQAARELAHRHSDSQRQTVAAPTTSATRAASRRLIGSRLLEHQRRIRDAPAALDRGRRAPGSRDLRRHRAHPDAVARRRR